MMAPRAPRSVASDRRHDHAGETYVPPRRRWEELNSIEKAYRVGKEWGSVIVAVAVFLGVRVTSPKDDIREMREEIVALRVQVSESGKRTAALVRHLCASISDLEAYKLDLDCTGLPRNRSSVVPNSTGGSAR